MTKEELNVIEKYMTADEIKAIIEAELKGKLHRDFDEMYANTLFNPKAKYDNNIIYQFFRDYALEFHRDNIEAIVVEKIKGLSIDHIIGHTWDLADHPDAMNRIKGREIIHSALESVKPQIAERFLTAIANKSDDDVLQIFGNMFMEKIYDILLHEIRQKSK